MSIWSSKTSTSQWRAWVYDQITSAVGGVSSVFGRAGAVVAQQSDYDAWFLTPAEGDAAYSALGHSHIATDVTDFDAEVANNSAVALNTAKNTYPSADATKLAGIETAATADQTAAELLTAIKTVDGSGSGLDADLLDGANASITAGGSTIVKRHASGYIYANYFNTTPNDVTSGVTKVLVESGNDGFMRHGTVAAIVGYISGTISYSDLANGTDGELITWSATGVPATVAVGTADQVLTSNGAGAAPTFQDASGGAPTHTGDVTGDTVLAIAADVVGQVEIKSSTTTAAGDPAPGNTNIAFNNWALYPMKHGEGPAAASSHSGVHITDGGSAAAPRTGFLNAHGSNNRQYDYDHRWIVAV